MASNAVQISGVLTFVFGASVALTTVIACIINFHSIHAYFCRKDDEIVPRQDHEVCTFSQHIESNCKSGPFSFGTDVALKSFRPTCIIMNHTITCSCREDLCNRVINVKAIVQENLKGPADVSFCNHSDMIMADCIQLLKCLLANLELTNGHQGFDDYLDGNISIVEVEEFPRNKHSRLKHLHTEDNHFFILLVVLVMVAHIVVVVVLMIAVNRSKDKSQSSSEKSARLKASRAEVYNEERIEAGKIVQFRC